MSLAVPLAVRLRTTARDVHVTREVRNLAFRSVAPGGFAACLVQLDRPLSLQPGEIAEYGRLYVYDARNGSVVWEGRLEDPGRSAGADGEVWELTAMGPSAHTQDQTVPLIYIDRSLDRWVRADNVTPGGTDAATEDPGGSGEDAMALQWPSGLPLVTNSRVVVRYLGLWETGQKLGAYNYRWDAGVTSASNNVEGVTRTDGVGGEVSRTQTWDVAGGGGAIRVVVTDFPNGRNTLDLRILYTGGGVTVGNDTSWASFLGAYVEALRYTAAGAEKTAGYGSAIVASDIVNDLLGRTLSQYDGANAAVSADSFDIDQLAYPDGVTAAQVLEDLMVYEPGKFWAAWESNAAGKYRFEWSAWPTTVRYVATAADGFESPGSAEGLYNCVTVRWRDARGRSRTTRRTSSVASLTAAGLTRTAFLDLGDQGGSSANATRAGDQFLAEHAAAPNAGRLTVARPILDRVSGRNVMPWEIRPGNLVRVGGVLPRLDSLNATARDGVTVFRVAAVDYSQDSNTAVLELDSYSVTEAAALARLDRKAARTRR